MKKILTVYTGGTICSAPDGKKRALSLKLAESTILANFLGSDSSCAKYGEDLFYNSGLESEFQTLSENMTTFKLEKIVNHIKSFDMKKYCGIIVLHGTDTLAFTSNLFAFVFSDISVPVMIVSGNRPPMDKESNANDNFRTAVELIMEEIPPNVYVPYRNSDGKMYIHLGSTLLQCKDFSEDFFSASSDKTSIVNTSGAIQKEFFEKYRTFSDKRTEKNIFKGIADGSSVTTVFPYPGLNYKRISLENVDAILHASYHSQTVCVENDSEYSVVYLAQECKKWGIPLFIAPCTISDGQYSSVYDLAENTDAILLDMSFEAAYVKLLLAIGSGITQYDQIKAFVCDEINNEKI